MSISKIFYQTLCVLSQIKDQTEFLFCHLGHAPGMGLWGTGGALGFKNLFFQTWLCGISNRRDDEQQSASKNTGDLGARSKGQISLNISYHVNFKDFYTELCVCSHK